MIISRTPFRISFAGGGSDIADFYEKQEGAVISTTINKHIYLSFHQHFDGKTISLKYRRTEHVTSPTKIKHPILQSVLIEKNIRGVEIASISDVPGKAGLGSSSAFTVGLHHILAVYKGEKTTREELARRACETEIGKLKEPIGKQDQYAAAYGGFNFMRFLKNGQVIVEPLNLKVKTLADLEGNLLLFFTGITRPAKTILQIQKEKMQTSKKAFSAMTHMVELAYQMKDTLENEDVRSFGKLLHQGWVLKKSLFDSMTNEKIEYYYNRACEKGGALGGKITGAGGGGFLLLYCEKEHQKKLRVALRDLKELPFTFSNRGSEIVFNNTN